MARRVWNLHLDELIEIGRTAALEAIRSQQPRDRRIVVSAAGHGEQRAPSAPRPVVRAVAGGE